jgi:glutathione synthase/RimK-type ligase-like ATP-grasp enzyme
MKIPSRVALATYAALPGLSDDDRSLLGELWSLGVKAEPAVWDDASVDWKSFDAVILRSTWDYFLSPSSFSAWLSRLEEIGARLWNPIPIIRANSDKSYLKSLEAAGLPTVPTVWVEAGGGANLDALLAAQGWRDAVVKPVVSGGAFRTSRVKRGNSAGQAALDEVLAHSGAMIQPYLVEIASEGEWSFIFIDGEFSHAVLKMPRSGDFRVQEIHGGRTERREPPPQLLAQARAALGAGAASCLYARVDGVRRGGELVIVELELIEPALYLAHAPGAARKLAQAIKARISAPWLELSACQRPS